MLKFSENFTLKFLYKNEPISIIGRGGRDDDMIVMRMRTRTRIRKKEDGEEEERKKPAFKR